LLRDWNNWCKLEMIIMMFRYKVGKDGVGTGTLDVGIRLGLVKTVQGETGEDRDGVSTP